MLPAESPVCVYPKGSRGCSTEAAALARVFSIASVRELVCLSRADCSPCGVVNSEPRWLAHEFPLSWSRKAPAVCSARALPGYLPPVGVTHSCCCCVQPPRLVVARVNGGAVGDTKRPTLRRLFAPTFISRSFDQRTHFRGLSFSLSLSLFVSLAQSRTLTFAIRLELSISV